MGKYFTIGELSRSSKTKARGIDNTPPKAIEANMERFISVILDPLREKYGAPIYVNSGYRNKVVNKLVGGVANSHHLYEYNYCAADITTKNKLHNAKLFNLVKEMNLPVCQCIDEYNYSWVHISYNPNDIRKQFIHKK